MGWDIRVWHDDLGERSRLVIEAGEDVPDEVIATIAGSYWLDQVQYAGVEWDEGGEMPDSGPHMHG